MRGGERAGAGWGRVPARVPTRATWLCTAATACLLGAGLHWRHAGPPGKRRSLLNPEQRWVLLIALLQPVLFYTIHLLPCINSPKVSFSSPLLVELIK